jgi:hypothetical protein
MNINSIDFAREYTQWNGKSRYPLVPTRAKSTILHAAIGTPFSEAKSIAMCRNHLRRMRTKPLAQNSRPAQVLVGVDRVRLQIFQVAKRQARFMRRRQDHFRSVPGVECFLPPWGTQTPLVAGLQTGKSKLQVGSRKIVSCCLGECQKLGGKDDANRVRPHVFWTRVTAAIAEKARHGRCAAGFQLAAEHVFSLRQPDDTICFCNANHGQLCFEPLRRAAKSVLLSLRERKMRLAERNAYTNPLGSAAEPWVEIGVWYNVRRTCQTLARGQPDRHCSVFRGQWR